MLRPLRGWYSSILFYNNELILSWKIMYPSISYPWHSTKMYLVHIISGSLLCTDIISISVELRVLHFIMSGELIAAPFPIVIRHPTYRLQSSLIWCNPPTYQCTVKFISSALRISFIYRVPFMYFNCSTRTSFPQSSSSGAFTQVVRNDTAIWMSHLTLSAAKSSWYTVWWKASDSSSFSFLPSLRTLKRWSLAGVVHIPVISLGNSFMTSWGSPACWSSLHWHMNSQTSSPSNANRAWWWLKI
jgi:hypothetical protein